MAFNSTKIRELAGQFLARAENQKATAPLMIGHRLMGTSFLLSGNIVEGRTHYDRALALYDPGEHRLLATQFGQEVAVATLSFRSLCLWILGYPMAALTDAEQAISNARQMGQAAFAGVATLMYALAFAGLTPSLCGDHARRKALVDELVSLAEEKGTSFWKAFGMMEQGWLLTLTGKASSATQLIASGITLYRSGGSTNWLPTYLSHLSVTYAKLGQFDDSWRCIGESMTAIEMTEEKWFDAEVNRTAGEVAMLTPERHAAKAEAYFERALASRENSRQNPGNYEPQ